MTSASMPRIVACRALAGRRIWLRFDDALVGSVDLNRLMELGHFRALRDTAIFEAVSVDRQSGRVGWLGARIWLDPKALYEVLVARGGHRLPTPEKDPAFQHFMAQALSKPGKKKRPKESKRVDGEND